MCNRCGYCCMHVPCAVFPRDVKRACKIFNCTPLDLFKTILCIDSWDGNYFVRVRREGQARLLCDNPEKDRSPCMFLLFDGKQHGCGLQGLKPKGAEGGCGSMTTYMGTSEKRCSLRWRRYQRGNPWFAALIQQIQKFKSRRSLTTLTMNSDAYNEFKKRFDTRVSQHNAEIGEDVQPIIHSWEEKDNMYYLRFNYVQEWFGHVIAEFEKWLEPRGAGIIYNIFVEQDRVVMEFYF